MKTLHLSIIVILLSIIIADANAYPFGYLSSVMPSPPLEMYPYTSKIFSIFQIVPEGMHPNDTATVHILVTNNANFTLHDVNVGESFNDSRYMTLANLHKIDILDPNQTKAILGTLHVSSDMIPNDYHDIWWTIAAKNKTGNIMESMQFHRNVSILENLSQQCCDKPATNNDSPLQQFKSGITSNSVVCKAGLQLVIKTRDGLPACVKPDSAYTLIYRGWAKEFIQAVTWTNQSTCEGAKIPSGNFRKNIFPVLIMPPNSTATVCVTYNFMSDWQSYPNKDVYPHGILETCCFVHPGWYSSPTLSNKFSILANPPLFNVTGVMNNSKISVTYKIYAKSDSVGFYDTSVPFDGCLSYPLAVGHDTSEVDATKFHADFAIPCFASIENVDSVNIVSGMTHKEVQFP